MFGDKRRLMRLMEEVGQLHNDVDMLTKILEKHVMIMEATELLHEQMIDRILALEARTKLNY